jgi:hypothetical protein
MAESKPPIDDDDDAELELAPIDPEILAHERRRADQKTQTVLEKIDVDELFEQSAHTDFDLGTFNWKQFRFTTRDLMIATAGLAVVLTVFQLAGACNAIFWLTAVALGAGFFWVNLQERRREAERQRMKEEFLAGVRKTSASASAEAESAEAATPRKRFEVKFSFSMKELFATMTVAVVVVFLLQLMGPHNLAWILGMIAIAGIIANIAGFEAAPIIVLGWWLLLVVYLLVGLAAIFTEGKAKDAAQSGVAPRSHLALAFGTPAAGSTSGSITPWSCSHTAMHQQTSAHENPRAQPASTSLGQWTPKYTRVTPTAAVTRIAIDMNSTFSRRRETNRDATNPSVRYTAAAIVECPLGKLEV